MRCSVHSLAKWDMKPQPAPIPWAWGRGSAQLAPSPQWRLILWACPLPHPLSLLQPRATFLLPKQPKFVAEGALARLESPPSWPPCGAAQAADVERWGHPLRPFPLPVRVAPSP